MKKLLFLIPLLIIIFTLCTAQEIIYVTEADIAWDAVTELTGDIPIPTEDTIEYEVWLRDTALVETLVTTTSATTYHLVLPGQDTYTVGVRTKRTAQGGTITYSDMNWSNINGTSTPNPFVYAHPNQQIPPKPPQGLRTQ